ncbi:MAG: hypothetical protein ABW166_04070 [Sedimenticola sp.]
MGRSRYVISEVDKPHFLTCTVQEWLPLFTRPDSVEIILESLRHLQQHEGLKLYGYVILENHLHFVAQAPRLDKCVSSFKSFTAKQLLHHLERPGLPDCWIACALLARHTSVIGSISFGRRAHTRS